MFLAKSLTLCYLSCVYVSVPLSLSCPRCSCCHLRCLTLPCLCSIPCVCVCVCAEEMLERALYALELAWHPTFSPAAASMHVPYEQANAPLFTCLFRCASCAVLFRRTPASVSLCVFQIQCHNIAQGLHLIAKCTHAMLRCTSRLHALHTAPEQWSDELQSA
jgi:hypothetical protein